VLGLPPALVLPAHALSRAPFVWPGGRACSTLAFSLRIASGSKRPGASIRVSASILGGWFCGMSPQGAGTLVSNAGPSSTADGFAAGDLHAGDEIAFSDWSKIVLAKRSTRMFLAVSLPQGSVDSEDPDSPGARPQLDRLSFLGAAVIRGPNGFFDHHPAALRVAQQAASRGPAAAA